MSLSKLACFVAVVFVASCGKKEAGDPFVDVALETRNTFLGMANRKVLVYPNMHVQAIGDLNSYKDFQFGLPAKASSELPHLLVALPNESIVDISAAGAAEMIYQSAPHHISPGQDSVGIWGYSSFINKGAEYWPRGTDAVRLNPYHTFYILENRIIGLRVRNDQSSEDAGDAKMAPKLGKSVDALYSLPLSNSDVMELFGKPVGIVEAYVM